MSEQDYAYFCTGCLAELRDTSQYRTLAGDVFCLACVAEHPEFFQGDPAQHTWSPACDGLHAPGPCPSGV